MRSKTIVAHLSVPAALAVGVFIVALTREPFGLNMLTYVLFGGLLFYAAPHLLWAVVLPFGKFSRAVSHAGFIAPSLALVFIAGLWFFPQDPSGLPLQWMLYWPLAVFLQIILVGITATYCHIRAQYKALQATPKRGAAEL